MSLAELKKSIILPCSEVSVCPREEATLEGSEIMEGGFSRLSFGPVAKL